MKRVRVYTKSGQRDFLCPCSYFKKRYGIRPLDTLLANYSRCKVVIVRDDGREIIIRGGNETRE